MRRPPLKIAACLVPPTLLAAALLCTGNLRLEHLQQERDGYAGKNVVLNEISTKNLTISVEGNTRTDWIELYNPTEEDYDLSGCFLSDKSGEPEKWQFPEGTVLGEGGYLLLQADGTGEGLHPGFSLRNGKGSLFLFDAELNLLDRLDYPTLGYDLTYGRRLLDGENAGSFSVATPGGANPIDFWHPETTEADLGTVQFSAEGGFYADDFSLQLAADDPEALILYTLDGSEPTLASEIYLAPLSLSDRSDLPNRYVSQKVSLDGGYLLNYAENCTPDPVPKSTTVTARLYKDGVLGDTVTAQTYWIGVDVPTLPIVSVSAAPQDLFGISGIYMPGASYFTLSRYGIYGRGNFSSGEKAEGQVQLFTSDATRQYGGSCEIKISGGSSLFASQMKSLHLYLDESCTLPQLGDVQGFILRGPGSGNVYPGLHQDAFLNNYLFDQGLCTQYNIPLVLYLEDEYWGIYTLREVKDSDLVARHFGVNPNKVRIHNSSDFDRDPETELVEGIAAVLELPAEERVEASAQYLDLDDLNRYLISQMYTYNEDGIYNYGNNAVLWRTTADDESNPVADGRWRYIINDYDNTLRDVTRDPFAPLFVPLDVPLSTRTLSIALFDSLWECPDYRDMFAAECRQALATTYAPENILPAFDAWCALLRPELALDFSRRSVEPTVLAPLAENLLPPFVVPQNMDVEAWEENAETARNYLSLRADIFLDYLNRYLDEAASLP